MKFTEENFQHRVVPQQPESSPTAQEKIKKDRRCENYHTKSLLALRYDDGYLLNLKDLTGLHRPKRQNQRRQLSIANPSQFNRAMKDAALRRRWIHASVGLGSGAFGLINDQTRQISRQWTTRRCDPLWSKTFCE